MWPVSAISVESATWASASFETKVWRRSCSRHLTPAIFLQADHAVFQEPIGLSGFKSQTATSPFRCLIDLNATKAAERAGYSAKTAYSQGQRLLQNAAVRAEIQDLMDRRAAKLAITAEGVLAELALIGFANMIDYIGVERDGSGTRRSVETHPRPSRRHPRGHGRGGHRTHRKRRGWGKSAFANVRRTKFKLSGKRTALVDLGRHLKLFTDKVQVDGEL